MIDKSANLYKWKFAPRSPFVVIASDCEGWFCLFVVTMHCDVWRINEVDESAVTFYHDYSRKSFTN